MSTKKPTPPPDDDGPRTRPPGDGPILEPLRRDAVAITIEGVSPLIVHRWDEKARRIMLEAQTTRTRTKKALRDPVADYEASMYRLPDGGHGAPAVAFKAAMIDAVSLFAGLTKVAAKRSILVRGEGPEQLVRLAFPADGLTMREDTVRLSRGSGADLRYRAQYWPWAATLEVVYLSSVLDEASVLALVDAAGSGGIGEWRPSAPNSSSGSYGTWTVAGE